MAQELGNWLVKMVLKKISPGSVYIYVQNYYLPIFCFMQLET